MKDADAATAAPAGVLEANPSDAILYADMISLLCLLFLFVGLLWFKSVAIVCFAVITCAASASLGTAQIAPRQWLFVLLFAIYGLFQMQYMAGYAAPLAAAGGGAPAPAAAA